MEGSCSITDDQGPPAVTEGALLRVLSWELSIAAVILTLHAIATIWNYYKRRSITAKSIESESAKRDIVKTTHPSRNATDAHKPGHQRVLRPPPSARTCTWDNRFTDPSKFGGERIPRTPPNPSRAISADRVGVPVNPPPAPFDALGKIPLSPNQGWDPELIRRCQANEAAISSVEGLTNSREFQRFIRDEHGNGELHLRQIEGSTQMLKYAGLFDHDAFVECLSRRDIQEFESVVPSRLLLLLETLSSTASALLLAWLCLTQPWGLRCAAAWLLLLALMCWPRGNPSLFAWATSIFCVKRCERYTAHELPAGLFLTASAALLDLGLCVCSLGISSLLSAALLSFAKDPTRSPQTLGQRLLRVYPSREVVRPAQVVAPARRQLKSRRHQP